MFQMVDNDDNDNAGYTIREGKGERIKGERRGGGRRESGIPFPPFKLTPIRLDTLLINRYNM